MCKEFGLTPRQYFDLTVDEKQFLKAGYMKYGQMGTEGADREEVISLDNMSEKDIKRLAESL